MIKAILETFGYSNLSELNQSCWHYQNKIVLSFTIEWGLVFGAVSMFIQKLTGFNSFAFFAFGLLIFLETITGVHSAIKSGRKFSSRKFGRIFLKLGYYLTIVVILNAFAQNTNWPKISGFELDPFSWLYHGFSVAISFQLLISVLENLAKMGFKESKYFIGPLLRFLDHFFKIDLKDNDDEHPDNREAPVPPIPSDFHKEER